MERKAAVAMPSDLRSRNMGSILNVVCRMKQFTIVELAEATRMSRQTVTKAVNEFVRLRIVAPVGKASSTSVGGKRAVQFALNEAMYVICMSAGEHRTSFSLMTLDYRRVDTVEMRFLPEFTPEGFISESVMACQTLMERNGVQTDDLLGISYCMGGIVDEDAGLIRYAATVPEWGRDIPLRRMLLHAFPFETRLCIDNVCKICARTMISHDNLNQKSVAVLYCDYGMGVTHIDEGAIRQTSHKIAHEWGHMVLDPWDTEQCGCGAYGCAEVLLGEKRLRQKIARLSPTQQCSLMEGYDEAKDIRIHVMEKSEQGNPDARALVMYMADLFGVTLRNICLGIDPDYFVLLGAFSHCTEEFLARAKQKARENRYLSDIDLDLRPYPRSIRSLQEIGGVNTILRAVVDERIAEGD